MSNSTKDEADFKNAYGLKISEMIAECLWGLQGKYAVFVIASPEQRTISTHSVNATPEEAANLLLTAAQPYLDAGVEERVMQ